MTHSRHIWKKRVAPSLCALLASAGFSARAEEGPTLAAPGQLVVSGEVSPIVSVAHVTDEDDPPPAPPFELTPASGRRSAAQPAPVTGDAAPEEGAEELAPVATAPPLAVAVESPAALTPPAALNAADASAPEPAAPVTLPEEVHRGAHGLAPPPLHALDEEFEDVNISAPVPAEAPETELVQERFPNGSLKIAREVTQDRQGNFINHGSWKEWNIRGELIAEGTYKLGVRHGAWRRALAANESPLFSTTPYNQFKGPFVSEAVLEEGRLVGVWTIADAHGRKISEIEFANGARHGMASWYHANGRKMQQIHFENGVVVDEILTWRPDGALAAKEVYQNARKIETKTEHYAQNRRKSTGDYLLPKMVVTKEDDWWNCRLAAFSAEGEAQRHGAWTAWHPNGQVQVEGRFEYGRPQGEFTWYYSNGQKAAEGAYRNGERHGVWTWWHENGLKSSLGDFIDGKPAGAWTWWGADGKVAQKADFADGVPAHALEAHRKTIQATMPPAYRKP